MKAGLCVAGRRRSGAILEWASWTVGKVEVVAVVFWGRELPGR